MVIGSGIAGLTAALELSRSGQVILATKARLQESNTAWAQGGIACAIDPGDSIDAHIADTLRTGGGLCHDEVVRAILSAGPQRIHALEEAGVHFEHTDDASGTYDLGQEAGHGCRRVLHAGDITGKEIVEVLVTFFGGLSRAPCAAW